jgi:hypothetical protein
MLAVRHLAPTPLTSAILVPAPTGSINKFTAFSGKTPSYVEAAGNQQVIFLSINVEREVRSAIVVLVTGAKSRLRYPSDSSCCYSERMLCFRRRPSEMLFFSLHQPHKTIST